MFGQWTSVCLDFVLEERERERRRRRARRMARRMDDEAESEEERHKKSILSDRVIDHGRLFMFFSYKKSPTDPEEAYNETSNTNCNTSGNY